MNGAAASLGEEGLFVKIAKGNDMRFVAPGVALLVLASLYVGGYFATVRRNVWYDPSGAFKIKRDPISGKFAGTVMFNQGCDALPKIPVARPSYALQKWIGVIDCKSLFAPIHSLDRQLRKAYWSVEDQIPPP